MKLVEIEGLSKRFKGGGRGTGDIYAVDNVSLHIEEGETLGLVGESGCGKTTLGRTLLRLYKPDGGKILFRGEDITRVNMLPLRRKMQIVFQDPSSSLDPMMTVSEIIGEPIDNHRLASSAGERRDRVNALLERVGLNVDHAARYPHEFSGGQQQRVGIARALAVEPDFIVCDEPVSALDVSIQSQIINMLEDMQAEMGLSYLFIAHDISVVRHISRRIGVMYFGRLVELAPSGELVNAPAHPYSRALLRAVPIPDPQLMRLRRHAVFESEISNPGRRGCGFRHLCPLSTERCAESQPELREVSSGHWTACHEAASF
jgi:oligopeptide transport system ATP-binding protein